MRMIKPQVSIEGPVNRLVDVLASNCTGCRLCEMACSFRHERECSTTKSRIKILKGKEWAFDFPLLCTQCAEAPCIESCLSGALRRDDTTGVVLLVAENCTGCEACIDACPIHAIVLDPDKNIALKCDLCGGDPECVKWCTRDTLTAREVDLQSAARKRYMEDAAKCLQAIRQLTT